jgi:hypothetical protein
MKDIVGLSPSIKGGVYTTSALYIRQFDPFASLTPPMTTKPRSTGRKTRPKSRPTASQNRTVVRKLRNEGSQPHTHINSHTAGSGIGGRTSERGVRGCSASRTRPRASIPSRGVARARRPAAATGIRSWPGPGPTRRGRWRRRRVRWASGARPR